LIRKKNTHSLTDYKCPKCGKGGQVTYASKEKVSLICDNCKIKWVAVQGICPVCENMNKYARNGMCLECYKILKENRENEKIRKAILKG